MLPTAVFSWRAVLPKLLPLCCGVLWLMARFAPAEDLLCLESEDALTAGTLGFMPLQSHRFARVNGRHSLRMSAPRRVGLPYGSYPRLLLANLTTQAVRTKSPHVDLGATPNNLARKLGLSTISGPRGTAHRCLHRRNPVTESNRFRSVIPRETDHRFRFIPVTLTGSSEWVTGMNRNRASKGV